MPRPPHPPMRRPRESAWRCPAGSTARPARFTRAAWRNPSDGSIPITADAGEAVPANRIAQRTRPATHVNPPAGRAAAATTRETPEPRDGSIGRRTARTDRHASTFRVRRRRRARVRSPTVPVPRRPDQTAPALAVIRTAGRFARARRRHEGCRPCRDRWEAYRCTQSLHHQHEHDTSRARYRHPRGLLPVRLVNATHAGQCSDVAIAGVRLGAARTIASTGRSHPATGCARGNRFQDVSRAPWSIGFMARKTGSHLWIFHGLLIRMPIRNTTKSPSISAVIRLGITWLMFCST